MHDQKRSYIMSRTMNYSKSTVHKRVRSIASHSLLAFYGLPLLTCIALEYFLIGGSVVFMTNLLYSTQTLKLSCTTFSLWLCTISHLWYIQLSQV